MGFLVIMAGIVLSAGLSYFAVSACGLVALVVTVPAAILIGAGAGSLAAQVDR